MNIQVIIISGLLLISSGCSTLDPTRVSRMEENFEIKTDRLDKEQAAVASRIEEYEYTQSRLMQRIQLLEKALMLGLPLSELKGFDEEYLPSQPQNHTMKNDKHFDHDIKQADKEASSKAEAVPLSLPQDTIAGEQRKKHLIEAQAHFDSARYGRAIYEFEKLEEDDNQIYWIALSWLRLKDYLKAEQGFRKIVSDYPQSKWLARSKFYLAESDYSQGFQNRAVSQLRQIIEEHPDEDAAQLARGAIKQYERTTL